MSRSLPNFEHAIVVALPAIDLGDNEGLSSLRAVLAAVPEISRVEPGALVAIAGELKAERPTKLLDRMMGRKKPRYLHRAVRCTALFAKGYVRVGGGQDDKGVDWAFGWAPGAD